MSVLSVLFTLLTGCGKSIDKNENQTEAPDTMEERIIPTPFPEGTQLRHFYITHQGMRAGSYYIMKTTDAGTYMKVTNTSPNSPHMQKDISDEEIEYLRYADTVKDCEYASLVLLEEDTPVRELEQAIEKFGALDWDGFDESMTIEGVPDSGDSYQMYLELSDGTSVAVDSYNVCPAGFKELLSRVQELFDKNSDYSRYLAADFDTSACIKMYVSFQKSYGQGEWKLELQEAAHQWIVVLMDREGIFVEENTEIADYQFVEEELPFERFLDIFRKHGAEVWNGYEESDSESREHFVIRLNFEDGTYFKMEGNLPPKGFEVFQKELIAEMNSFYNEYKNKKREDRQ